MAFSYRDANEGNLGVLRTYLEMDRARDLGQLEAAQANARGLSWLNVIATSRDGTALFFDASRTPALSDAAEASFRSALRSDFMTLLLRSNRQTLLAGNTSLFDWQDRDPHVPGVFAQSESPRLERSDFVSNANDSHWLVNPEAPLTGFSKLFGDEPDDEPLPMSLTLPLISARTRMNLKLLTETGKNGTSGADGKFSIDELSAVPYNSRALLGELLRDAVVKRCKAAPSVDVNGKTVDLHAACSALGDWDLRLDVDSAGAPLWREFLADFFHIFLGTFGLFEDSFDANDPIDTPRTLTARDDVLLPALGRAVERLRSVGADEAVTLGELQFAQRGDARLPIPGGVNAEGAFNIVGYEGFDGTLLPFAVRSEVVDGIGLTAEGYPVNAGSSFMLITAFTDDGPEARAVLTYSQSADPESPHYADQTRLFAAKKSRDVLFSEDDIAEDPELREERVTGP